MDKFSRENIFFPRVGFGGTALPEIWSERTIVGGKLIACVRREHLVCPFVAAPTRRGCHSRYFGHFYPTAHLCPRDKQKSTIWPWFSSIPGTTQSNWAKASYVARTATSQLGSWSIWNDKVSVTLTCDQSPTTSTIFRFKRVLRHRSPLRGKNK